jgi:hypothetical protein
MSFRLVAGRPSFGSRPGSHRPAFHALLCSVPRISRQRFPHGFVERGIVLYFGDRVVPLGDRIWALPVPVLWAD